jgi:hypothetical protein
MRTSASLLFAAPEFFWGASLAVSPLSPTTLSALSYARSLSCFPGFVFSCVGRLCDNEFARGRAALNTSRVRVRECLCGVVVVVVVVVMVVCGVYVCVCGGGGGGGVGGQ